MERSTWNNVGAVGAREPARIDVEGSYGRRKIARVRTGWAPIW
jgi:hypothetical protein